MKLETINRKQFELSDNGQLLATVHFPTMTSMRAEVELQDDTLHISPESCWKTTYQVTDTAGRHRATIKAKWNGTAEVSLLSSLTNTPTIYKIKRKGIFSWVHEVRTQNDRPLLNITGKWSWRRLNNHYTITRSYPMQDPLFAELTAYALFISQLQIRQSS